MAQKTDILVAGGGPAGCIAAIGLAGLGHSVRLITTPRRPAVEGLSERVLRALEGSGCRRALGVVGPAVRREAGWNGVASTANREWVVAREHFDLALLEDAAAAGVGIVARQLARPVQLGAGWVAETGRGERFESNYLVEARGRRAPGRRLRGPATTALGRLFEGVPTIARTAVAGFRRGWAWYATTGSGRGVLQIIVSSAPPLAVRRELPGVFDQLLEQVPEARAWLGTGRAAGEVWARHAETSRACAPLEDGMIRVGDAALALDPLCGHGVFEAIASATAAVPVVNTLLRRPAQSDLARTFYEERVDFAFARFARIGRDFHILEHRFADDDFWRERRLWPEDQPAHAPASAGPPVIATKPVIEDGFIAARPVLVTADQPRGVWQVDGVPIVALLEWHRRRAGALAAPIAGAAAHFARSERQIATALDWLRYRRLIG
jgi:flavin-dependent dehydrogenase